MIEIKQSQYSHPDQTTGQHTNGPPNIFVRQDSESPWYRVVGIRTVQRVQREIFIWGFWNFIKQWDCKEVE